MAIRRFIARRGYPRNIYCDQGTNFKSADKVLREEINRLEKIKIVNTMTAKQIDFHFNPPGAPHMGGTWERLIASVKRAFGKILYSHHLKEETLQTVLTEVENIINSRPLTRVSSDPNDLNALTPNHFLMGWSNVDSLVKNDISGNSFRSEWKKSQMIINSLWQRWAKEYLTTLNTRSKWTSNLRPPRPLETGDVVILVDENAPRYQWKMGRIVKTYPGLDKKVRVVDVKINNSVYRRPVTKVGRLEVNETDK